MDDLQPLNGRFSPFCSASLLNLAELARSNGIVLYAGRECVASGEGLFAAPMTLALVAQLGMQPTRN